MDSQERALECQKKNTYEYALGLLETGRYDEAKSQFDALGDFLDSKEKSILCTEMKQDEENNTLYLKAKELYNISAYKNARDVFLDLGSYKDSIEYVDKCIEMIYQQAIIYKELRLFEQAINELSLVSDYKDSISLINECNFGIALNIINDEGLKIPLIEAFNILENIDISTIDYEDLRSAKYILAKKLVMSGDYTTGIKLYK